MLLYLVAITSLSLSPRGRAIGNNHLGSNGGIGNWQHGQTQIAATTSLGAFIAYGVERVS